MDTTSGVVTVPTIVPASTSTNATAELTATSIDINVNQSNNNSSSAHIAGDTGNSSSNNTTAVAAATTSSSSNNGSSNSNSNSSSSSTSSNSSGYGSTTTTPTNSNYETQQQQQTPTPTRTPTTPVAIAEPIIPVATVAAVTPFYNEAITTHNLEIQHQQHHHQQQQQQQQQQHQLQQNLQHHQYLPRHQYYSSYDYQQQSSNLSSSGSATTPYNMSAAYDIVTAPSLANAAATSTPYVAGEYKSSNLSAINYERNLNGRPTAAATTYYHHRQQVQNEQNSKSLQNLLTTTQQPQFAKQRSSTSLITSSTNPNTSKPQAAATPFYAQPLPQPSNPSTYYDSLKHTMPLEYHSHHHDSYTNPTTATYHQQQKYYAAVKSQLKEATSYGSPGLSASKSLYPNPTNFFPSSTGNHGLSSAAYDKYMYPHATATGYPTTSHLVNENPPDTSYRKTAVANTLNSPSWPWGIEYASGNSRTIPPPTTTHLPTATVAPTHATYLTPNPSALARDPYYMAQDKYNMKYDKYSTAACPPSYQQSYVSPSATRHHMWPSSHGPQLNDRHHLVPQPTAPIPQHGLTSTAYYPTNSASVLNSRQSCFPQPYQPQSCYYPSPHAPSSRLSHNQPPPSAMAPNAAAYMSTQQPLGQTSHLNALSSSCKYGGVMADYGSGNKLKNPNDLYLTSHYDSNNYGTYGSNQLYQPNAHHGPSQGSILNHDSLAISPAPYTNDLNLTSNFDNYPAHPQDSHITPNTFGAIHSQTSPQYAPTVVKRALLDYRKPIQPQPPPVGQEELSYTTLTTASREQYQHQELLNTPETTTTFADYDTNQEVSGLTYNQTSEGVLESDKATEEANKNLSLRDFIANWNDDEDEYNNTEELNFGETTPINEVLQDTAQKPELNDAALEPSPLMENLKPVETKESDKLTEKLTEALNVNLPDIIIDIEKSNNVNNSITTPSTSPTSNIGESAIILNNFDVEQELDELKKKKEDEKLEIAKDINDIKGSSGSSVTTPQLSPCKNGVTTQLSFEDLNLEQPNKTVLLTSRPDCSSTNEQYFKDIEGYDSGSSRHSNESAFEKEYETFINKITSETTSKTNSDSVKTAGETEIDFEQNVQDFSKFYKRKRKLKEDEIKSSLSPNTQNKKKIKPEMVNNSNFPQVYTKKSRNRILKHNNAITRKHKPLSFYYKIIHSLRRYRLYRIKRVRHYIAELKEKHLPLIKRQSIKNYSHAVQENIYQPKSLKSLTVMAINTTEFRERIILCVKESSENISESEEKHICTDPSCETCEVIRSLMEPANFEDLKSSTESEEIHEIPEGCINTGTIYQDLPEYPTQYPKADILLCENSEILLCETLNSENEQQIGDSVNVGSLLQVLIPETNEELETAKETNKIKNSLESSSEKFSKIIKDENIVQIITSDVNEVENSLDFHTSNQKLSDSDENIIEIIPAEVREAEKNLDFQNSNQIQSEKGNSETEVINQGEGKKETNLEKIPEKLDIESKILIESGIVKEELKSFNILSSHLNKNLEYFSNKSPISPICETTSPKSNIQFAEDLEFEDLEIEKDTYPILKISELLKKSQKLEKKLESPTSPSFDTTSPEANKNDSNNLQPEVEKDLLPILKMSELLKKSQKFEKQFSESFESDKNLNKSNTETNLSDDEDSNFSDNSHSEKSDNDELLNKSPNHKDENTDLQKDLKLNETSKEYIINEQIVKETKSIEGLREASVSVEPNIDYQAVIGNENIPNNEIDDSKIVETEIIAKENEKSVEVSEDDSEESDSSDSDSESSSNSDSDSDEESMDDDKASTKLSTDTCSSSDSDSECESEEETTKENVAKSIIEKSLPPCIEPNNDSDGKTKIFTDSVEEPENLKESENSSLPSEVDNKFKDYNIVRDKSPKTLSKHLVKENSKTINIITDSKSILTKSSLEYIKDSDSEWDDESDDENAEIVVESPKIKVNIVKASRETNLNSPKLDKESENDKLQPTSNENKLKDLKSLSIDTKIILPSSLEENNNSDSDWNDESDEEITENIAEKPPSNEKGLKLILKLKDIKSYQPFRKEHLQNFNKNSRTNDSATKNIAEIKLKEVGKSLSQTKLPLTLKNIFSKISDTDIDSYSDFETETEDDNIYMECYNKPGQKSVQILKASQTLLQNNLEHLLNVENSNISQSSHHKSLDFFQSIKYPTSIVLSEDDDESMDISENLDTKNSESAEECLNHVKSFEEPKASVDEDAIIISDDEIVYIPNPQKTEESMHLKENNKTGNKVITTEILEESVENFPIIKTLESHQILSSEFELRDKVDQLSEVEKLNEITEKSDDKIDGFHQDTETENVINKELPEKDDIEKCTEFSEDIIPQFVVRGLQHHSINTSVEVQDSVSNEEIQELPNADHLEQIKSNDIAVPAIEELTKEEEYPEVLDLSLSASVKHLDGNKDNSEDSCSSEKSYRDDLLDNTKDKAGLNAENLSQDNLPIETVELKDVVIEQPERHDTSADYCENLNNLKIPHNPQELITNMETSENIGTNFETKSNEIISNLSNRSKNEELPESSGTTMEITEKLEDTTEELNQNFLTKTHNIVDDYQKPTEIISDSPDSPEKICNSSDFEELNMETSEFANKTDNSFSSKVDKIIKESSEIIPETPDSPEEAVALNEATATSTTEYKIAGKLEDLKPESYASKFEGSFEESLEVKKIIPDSPDSPGELVRQGENHETQYSPDSPKKVVTVEGNFNAEDFPNNRIKLNELDGNLSESSKDVLTNMETSQTPETSSVFSNKCDEKEDLEELKNFEDSTVREFSYKSPLTNQSISEPEESDEEEFKSPNSTNSNEIEILNQTEMAEESILKNFETIENKISENIEEDDDLSEPKSKEPKESELNENCHNFVPLNCSNNESEEDVIDLDTTVNESIFKNSDKKYIIPVSETTESGLNDKYINLEEAYEKSKTFFESLVEENIQHNSNSESSFKAPEINDFEEKSENSEVQTTDNMENRALESSNEEFESNQIMAEAKTDEFKVNDTFSEPHTETIDANSEPVVEESELHKTTSEYSKTKLIDDISQRVVDELIPNETFSKSTETTVESIDEYKYNDTFSESAMNDISEHVVDKLKLNKSTETSSKDEYKCIDTFSEPATIPSEPMEIISEYALSESKVLENISNSIETREDRIPEVIVERPEQKDSELNDNVILEPTINTSMLQSETLESAFKDHEVSHIDTNSNVFEEATTKGAETTEDQPSECSEKDNDLNETNSELTIKNFNLDNVLPDSLDDKLKQHQTIPESAVTTEHQILETMAEESEISDPISEPAIEDSELNDVTQSAVDELKQNKTSSESTDTLIDLIPETTDEEPKLDEHHEIIQESTETISEKISECLYVDKLEPINKNSELNEVISECAVDETESTKTTEDRLIESLEENSRLNDNFSETTIKCSELSINILETAADELHGTIFESTKTLEYRNTETINEESELTDTFSESAINESNQSDTVYEPAVTYSETGDITLEPTIQESLSNETVSESITQELISKTQTKEAALNESATEDQISESLIKVSQLDENISEIKVDETKQVTSNSHITDNKYELPTSCSNQITVEDLEPAIKEPDVSETISESILDDPNLNTFNQNIELNQTHSEDTKSDNSQHGCTQSQPELVTDKENTTEDLSGDFFGFKNQSSFEDESEDFHGFEDIEEATRIRREMENLNDDSAANDGFINSTLNKELQKSSTTSPTVNTTSEINELEALEKEISQQHIEKQREDENEKETDTVLVNETSKIISTNDIEHIKKMLESDEEQQQDETEYHIERDDKKSITSSDETTQQTKEVIKTITDSESINHNDNDIFVDNFRNISIDIINSVIPKLSDLCRAALNSSLNTNSLKIVQNVQNQIDKTDDDDTSTILVERELTVEEALAEMYRQAGVLLSDPEDNDNDTHRTPTNNCNEEAQDVLLFNLQEILNSDNDVYVLQCDMNENILNVVQTNNDNEDSTQENTERVNTVQFIGILDTENSEPQIHIISSDSESEVIILSDDCESDMEPTKERHERVIIPFINDFDNYTDDEGNLSDISTIHHEEIVPDNLKKFLQEEFYKYLHEKYVQRNISKYYHANRVLKKYKKRFVKKLRQ